MAEAGKLIRARTGRRSVHRKRCHIGALLVVGGIRSLLESEMNGARLVVQANEQQSLDAVVQIEIQQLHRIPPFRVTARTMRITAPGTGSWLAFLQAKGS